MIRGRLRQPVAQRQAALKRDPGALRYFTDLRGKRFCICMAGNPYTESGAVFKIPDMLANRADIYNLGDVLSGHEKLFSLSYIENCLTSNPVLLPLSSREPADVQPGDRFVIETPGGGGFGRKGA